MGYCHKHCTTNCIECAIEIQTSEIVRAINGLREPELPVCALCVLLHRVRLAFSGKQRNQSNTANKWRIKE